VNTLPVKESQIAGAILPETYKNARTAIEKCSRLDECKDWANKAEAIASYAKQAGDNTLRKCADRIQARAMLRVGELLKEIPGKVGRPENNRGGTSPISRSGAAKDAGLSRDDKRTALRVASVPKGRFDELVESDDPPTVTELAELGTRKTPYKHTVPSENFAEATKIGGAIRLLSRQITGIDPEYCLAGIEPHERKETLGIAKSCAVWLQTFIKLMEGTRHG
jgi:hypothetical protein